MTGGNMREVEKSLSQRHREEEECKKAYNENIQGRNWDITDVNRYYAMVNALERSQYKLGLFYNPFTKSFERWK